MPKDGVPITDSPAIFQTLKAIMQFQIIDCYAPRYFVGDKTDIFVKIAHNNPKISLSELI